LIGTLILAGGTATDIIAESPALTRVSLSLGILISAVGALIIILASCNQRISNRFLSVTLTWTWFPVLVILLATGWFNNLSVIQEYFNNSSRFEEELITHMVLFGISIAASVIIGVPLGILAAHSRKVNRPIFFLANIAQTIPSLALFGLLIAPLSALSTAFPVLQDIGIRGIGAAPAIIALVIYSLLPIIQNTYTGIHQINPGVIDAGLGMGMDHSELLRRVELPLASPLILTGVRTAAVQTVGTVAVAALIGAGGLGQLIFQGLGQAATDLIILGSVPIILIALAIDNIMQFVVKVSTPGGIAEPAL
jgi:osmoprotectant transport system permease protein